jgi:hypothetical protein
MFVARSVVAKKDVDVALVSCAAEAESAVVVALVAVMFPAASVPVVVALVEKSAAAKRLVVVVALVAWSVVAKSVVEVALVDEEFTIERLVMVEVALLTRMGTEVVGESTPPMSSHD